MNKILIILLAIVAISCNNKQEEQLQEQPATVYEEKYPYGTVMYAKPDSVKVVICQFDSMDNSYKAYWREGGEYATAWYSEEGFYGEVQTSINTSDE
jgi:hypothetical protein